MLITRSPKTALAASVLAAGMALGLTACSSGDTGGNTPAAVSEHKKLTVGSVVDKNAKVLAETSVGTTQYVVAQQGDEVRVGQTTNGRLDGWTTFADKPVAADSIVMSSGNSPDLGANGRAETSGKVGTDVVGLDIVTNDGATVPAAVANGWYVAAWDGTDFTDIDNTQQYVLHLKDGSTKTIKQADAPTFVD